MKRLFDLAAAGAGLLFLLPILGVIALLIKLDSPGPVLFRQERIGRFGHRFEIKKFRTMRHGSVGIRVTAGTDPRVTRVGRWLRRTKLDELPQLFNVVRGEMSLVGPRPEVEEYVSLWPASAAAKILSVRPGMTDPTAIKFLDEEAILADVSDPEEHYRNVIVPQKVGFYLEYVEHRSLLGDFRIICATIRKIWPE